MERRRCDKGLRLNALYLFGCGAWVKAESEKTEAAGHSCDPESWNAILERVEDAKAAHSKAQREYIDHVAACPICRPHGFDS